MEPLSLRLKKDKDFLILRGHPWVYREGVKEVPDSLQTGDEVKVFSSRGNFLGLGLVDLDSPIFVRLLLSSNESDKVADSLMRAVLSAVSLRKTLFSEGTDGYRIINGEGDGLGALIVDRFGPALSVQTYSAIWEPYLDLVVSAIRKEIPLKWAYRRNHVRRQPGSKEGLIYGQNFPDRIRFNENGLHFEADLKLGQKTGFFLDQRENRKMVGRVSNGLRVANICGYTGAFSVYALAQGAREVVTVDSAGPALKQAERNFQLNGFSAKKNPLIMADMNEFLESCSPGEFDLIILDPPTMAKSRKDVSKAVSAYKRLNTSALRLLPPGGLLFTASCSSHMTREAFSQAIQAAAQTNRKTVQILQETFHASDHPVSLGHPEGGYLHGFLLRVR